jgi:hypothetical protein
MAGMPVRRQRKEKAQRLREEQRSNVPERVEYTAEERSGILEDAIDKLQRGTTVKAIAYSHNMPARTLNNWLLIDERAEKARAQFIGAKLADALDIQKDATDQLQLAKGEKLFRSWAWIAERRLKMFAPPRDHAEHAPVQINIGITRDTQTRTIVVQPGESDAGNARET